MTTARGFASGFVFSLALASSASAAPLLTGFGGPADFGDEILGPNDDDSSAAISLAPAAGAAGLCFFDSNFTTMFVNNNGNITFNEPLGAFTPDPFPIADQPMIAPWWADVDTRGAADDVPPANRVYLFQEPGHIVVTWHDVGYFDSAVDKRNDFQLEISDIVDKDNWTITYRYNQIDWTTGDASDGALGLGGTPAQVGFDAGDGVRFVQLANSRTADIINIDEQTNVEPAEAGLFRFALRGCALPVCGDGTVDVGEECDDGNIRNGDGCNRFCVLDTDNDGLTDDEEVVLGTDPANVDTDGDGFFDGTEIGSVVTPRDSDGDTVIDALDPDSTSGVRSVFVVNTTDIHDDGTCDGADCTLLEALSASSGAAEAGSDVVIQLAPVGAPAPFLFDFTNAEIGVLRLSGAHVVLDGSTAAGFVDAPVVSIIGATIEMSASADLRLVGVEFVAGDFNTAVHIITQGGATTAIDRCVFSGADRALVIDDNNPVEGSTAPDSLFIKDTQFVGLTRNGAMQVSSDDIEFDGVVVTDSGNNVEGEVPAAVVNVGLRLLIKRSAFFDNGATGLVVGSSSGRVVFVSISDSSFGVAGNGDVVGNAGNGINVEANARSSVTRSVFAGNLNDDAIFNGNASISDSGFGAGVDGASLGVEPNATASITTSRVVLNHVTVLGRPVSALEVSAVDCDFGVDSNDVVSGFVADALNAGHVDITSSRVSGAAGRAIFGGDVVATDVDLDGNGEGIVCSINQPVPSRVAPAFIIGERHCALDDVRVTDTIGAAVNVDSAEIESTVNALRVRDASVGLIVNAPVTATGLDFAGVDIGVLVNSDFDGSDVVVDANTGVSVSNFASARVHSGRFTGSTGVVANIAASVTVDAPVAFIGNGDSETLALDAHVANVEWHASVCGYERGLVLDNGGTSVSGVGFDVDGTDCSDGQQAIDLHGGGVLRLVGTNSGLVSIAGGSFNLFTENEVGPVLLEGALEVANCEMSGSINLETRGATFSSARVGLVGNLLARNSRGDGIKIAQVQGVLPKMAAEGALGRGFFFDGYDPRPAQIKGGENIEAPSPFVVAAQGNGTGIELTSDLVFGGSVDGNLGAGVVVDGGTIVVLADVTGNGVGVAINDGVVEVDGRVTDNGTGIACIGGNLSAPTFIGNNDIGVDVRGDCIASLDGVVIDNNGIGARVGGPVAFAGVTEPPLLSLGDVEDAVVSSNGTGVDIEEGGTFVAGNHVAFLGNEILGIDRNGDGRSPNTGALTDAPFIASVTSEAGISTVSGFAPAGARVRFWSADVSAAIPQPGLFLFERSEGGAFDLDAGVGDYSDAVLGTVTGAQRFSFRLPTGLATGLLIATSETDAGTSEAGNLFSLDPCQPDRTAPTCDRDNDGLTNGEERQRGTNELLADSDGDHISDLDEGLADVDDDGVLDANESNVVDDDGDGLTDVNDLNDRNACVPDNSADLCDRDGDGLSNAEEEQLGTSPDLADSDEDGISDGAEARFDTDADGINNGLESNNGDLDNDGNFDDVDPIELPPECLVSGQTLQETVVLDEAADVVAFNDSGVACVIGYLIIGDDVGPVSLTNLKVVTGRVIVRESLSDSVTFPALTRAGSLEVEDNTLLETLSLPVLTLIDTDLRIVGNDVLVNLDIRALRRVGGSVIITDNGALTTLALPNLTEIGGDFTVTDNDALTTIELNVVVQIGGDVTFADNDALVDITLPVLTGVGGSLIVDHNGSLIDLDLPSLETVGGDLVISDNDALTSINAPALAEVGGDLRIEENDDLDTVELPGLSNVGGDLVIDPIDEGGTVNLGGLDTVGGDVRISTSATLTIPPGWVCDDNGACAEPCGDGVVSNDEACDDGDGDDGDGCSSQCKVEAGFLCAAGEGGASLCLPVGSLVNDDPPVEKTGCATTSTSTTLPLVALLLLLRRRRVVAPMQRDA